MKRISKHFCSMRTKWKVDCCSRPKKSNYLKHAYHCENQHPDRVITKLYRYYRMWFSVFTFLKLHLGVLLTTQFALVTDYILKTLHICAHHENTTLMYFYRKKRQHLVDEYKSEQFTSEKFWFYGEATFILTQD